MRRRTLLVVLAGLAVVVAAGVVVLWPRPERITRENFERIKEGMSQAEVEEILGPPGDYTTEPTDWENYSDLRGLLATDETMSTWVFDEPVMIVVFDKKSGRVIGKLMNKNDRQNTGALYTLLWRAKRQWHRWFP